MRRSGWEKGGEKVEVVGRETGSHFVKLSSWLGDWVSR